MTDRGEAGRRSIVSGPWTFSPAATAWQCTLGQRFVVQLPPEADGERGREGEEIKGLGRKKCTFSEGKWWKLNFWMCGFFCCWVFVVCFFCSVVTHTSFCQSEKEI